MKLSQCKPLLEITGGQFNFSLNTGQLEYIQERYLGKTNLFTDNHVIPAPVARVRRPCGARRVFLSAASART